MKKIIMIITMFCLMTTPIFADFDNGDIADIVKQIKAGENFSESGNVPGQRIYITVSGKINPAYYIDVKMQLCGIQAGPLVSCNRLKKAYPIFSPIITWKDKNK